MARGSVRGGSDGDKPVTIKDRIIGVVIGGASLALGIYMFVEPVSPLAGRDDEPTRAKTRLIANIIDWIWGWPGGIVLVLFGLLMLLGSVVPQSKKDETAPSDAG